MDILIPVRNQYLLFRQLYESIRSHIPDEEIGQIIVVDDHSPEKLLREYTRYLHERGSITLVRNGMPLPSYKTGIPISFLKSKGHGESLTIGLKYVTADYVFILDSDCIILRDDVLKNSLPCFDLDPLVMSVGQVVGGVRGIKVIGDKERSDPEFITDYTRKKPFHYGYTNACCMLVRMDAWKKHDLSYFSNKGWAHLYFTKSIFKKGYKTCNFDFFLDGYVIHLGKALLKNMRFKHLRLRTFKNGKPPYGMSFEDATYSAKNKGEFYAGYLELKIPSEEYDRLLEDTYKDLPFEKMAPPVNPAILGPPEEHS